MKKYTVTWPTRPSGLYSEQVWADDPTDAVRAASDLDWLTADGYTVAFDYTPMVWRLQRPYRWRSRHVAGPDFPDFLTDRVAFTPEPLDLCEVANRAMGAVKVGDALGHGEAEIHAAVGQILSELAPEQVAEVLAIVAAETREINAYTGGEF